MTQPPRSLIVLVTGAFVMAGPPALATPPEQPRTQGMSGDRWTAFNPDLRTALSMRRRAGRIKARLEWADAELLRRGERVELAVERYHGKAVALDRAGHDLLRARRRARAADLRYAAARAELAGRAAGASRMSPFATRATVLSAGTGAPGGSAGGTDTMRFTAERRGDLLRNMKAAGTVSRRLNAEVRRACDHRRQAASSARRAELVALAAVGAEKTAAKRIGLMKRHLIAELRRIRNRSANPGAQPDGFSVVSPASEQPGGFSVALPTSEQSGGFPVASPTSEQPGGFPVALPASEQHGGFSVALPVSERSGGSLVSGQRDGFLDALPASARSDGFSRDVSAGERGDTGFGGSAGMRGLSGVSGDSLVGGRSELSPEVSEAPWDGNSGGLPETVERGGVSRDPWAGARRGGGSFWGAESRVWRVAARASDGQYFAQGASRGRRVVQAALQWVGTPYSWGGGTAAGPSFGIDYGARTRGFDCSGLALYAWARSGVRLDHWTGSQWTSGPHIPAGMLRPGDLVFFATDTKDPDTIHHVGIFIGNGRMVEAPYTGARVRISSIWRNGFIGATRPA